MKALNWRILEISSSSNLFSRGIGRATRLLRDYPSGLPTQLEITPPNSAYLSTFLGCLGGQSKFMLSKYLLVIRNVFIVVVQLQEWRQILSQPGPPGRMVPTEQLSQTPEQEPL